MTLPIGQVLALRNFRLLLISTAISLFGSQFTLIAVPWLVLQMTGDPFDLGIVLALEGIPRAIFMILGGAICDRMHPSRIMLITDILSCLLMTMMAIVLYSGAMHIEWLYVFALLFGLVSGMAIPASNSIIPHLIQDRHLEAGNSLIMGVTQLAAFVGPSLAGILLGNLALSSHPFELAFALNAFSFAVSTLLLWMIQCDRNSSQQKEVYESVLVSIWSGVKYLWQDKPLRILFLMLTAMNFLLMGPLMVGIPLLANTWLSEGASAFGFLMSAFAGGGVVGCLLAGFLSRPKGNTIKLILISFIIAFGFVTAALGHITSTYVDCVLLFLIGSGNGYLSILLFAWMQSQSPKKMLGRLMSLLTFSNAGFLALSQLAAGYLAAWNLSGLFVLSGSSVLLLALISATRAELSAFELHHSKEIDSCS